MPSKSVRTVPDFKSEYMGSCSFCEKNRKPDPNHVIVSLDTESKQEPQAICEDCVTGAVAAVTREYRRMSERYKKPPQKPKGPKKRA